MVQRKITAIPEPSEDISFAVKRWLRMSCDRLHKMPKQMYIPCEVDAGTWSRWTSYEHPHTLPSEKLPIVLAQLGEKAETEFFTLIKRLTREAA